MLSRLLRVSTEPAIVASLIDISDNHRGLEGGAVRYVPLHARSMAGALPAILRLSRLIARERPRVILCWMYHAMIAGVLAARFSGERVPVFWNVRQALDDPAALSWNTRQALRVARRLSRLPDGIIFNSSRALDQHRRFGFANQNMEVIPNGFEPVAEQPACRVPQVFGIAARLHRQKDHATFFRAAARVRQRHPAARFMAVGAGLSDDNATVRDMIAEAGLSQDSITLSGEVTDMDAFYRSIDILVLSSRTEGFPNVVAEAMSYGKPVVTTDVGDAAAVVGETGLVVPPGDAEALGEAMCRMLGIGLQDYAGLSAAARRRVDENYSLPQIARRYASFIGQA
ncbi:glycosyltransferase [Kaistia sp. 32K]|uniref:glycosyltransferase n=1 Tax=Kaistia sp. 32K TaxID=2795690 RepID=UPI001FD5E7B2|nr:glycosyltransferase [Kaistia sp. 32K]